ncbi:MAG: S26 family signal peptidase [Saprospiraceae bacterium]|nr:S26 family signal peptidase [Saprospiraceae bacterium]
MPKEQDYLKQLREAHAKKDARTLKTLEKSPYKKGMFREWIEAIVFAVFAAAFIRMFLIEAYVIPTSSMEGSLLVGDYLFVSKAHYGIRTPMTVVQVPLLHNQVPVLGSESYITKPNLPYYRLAAIEPVQRNKPFVFNWPIGDSVYITPNRSWNIEQIRQMSPPQLRQAQIPYPFDESNLVIRPLDKKDHYIKRCVAIAGDKFEVRDRQIYINDQPAIVPKKVQFLYTVSGNGNLNTEEMIDWGVNVEEGFQSSNNTYVFALTNENIERIKTKGFNVTVYPRNENSPDIFPQDTAHFKWSVDNFGPLVIPAAGATVQLSPENIALYRRIITVYESNSLEQRNGEFFINGSKTNSYTFKQNYYWAMGDNRHNSEDSRFWGFVPHDHIVGRPLLVWMSTGKNGIRWNRIFTSANKD